MFKKVLTSLVVLSIIISNAYASTNYDLTNVDSQTSSKVKAILSSEVQTGTGLYQLNGDVKIFKDIEISSIETSVDDNTKLFITLSGSLESNTSYSFLSVYGVEGNMDFFIANQIEGTYVDNFDEEENVSSIIVSSPNSLEVTFKTPLTGSEFDVKILKNLRVNSIELNPENKLELNFVMQDLLEENSNYILMMFTLMTMEGNELTFSNGIYDFQTTTFIEQTLVQEPVIVEEIIPEVVEDSGETLDGEIEEVALNAAETPDTGAQTWVLLLMTFILSSLYFLRKRA
ncbi:MAG: hypothetical protein PHH06_00475 [Candidatus Gracilibacteria bacterium]|nr:hypothetical protein [Candidatus Gracilibacteria bacterium]